MQDFQESESGSDTEERESEDRELEAEEQEQGNVSDDGEVDLEENSENSDTDSDNDNNATSWEEVDKPEEDSPVVRNFTSPSGPTWAPAADTLLVEYFDKYFEPLDEEGSSMWNLFLSETNKYFSWRLAKAGVLQKNSKMHKWKPLELDGLRAFIGLILNMGLVHKHRIEEYWNSTNYSQDTPMFRKIFTLDTFKLILRFFHASDSDTEPKRGTPDYDPQYKFHKVLDHFNATWTREYNLTSCISIDESIVGFKGRHVLVNYIRIKKHHQWGPKEYSLADSSSGYVTQTMYHVSGGNKSKHGQPYDVCNKLLANHGQKNHHLVVDNYYTIIPLCEQMLQKQIYVTGTVRSNRRGLPNEIKAKLKEKDAVKYLRKGQLLAVSWVDRKQVRLLSTHAPAGKMNVTRRQNRVKSVPKIVAEYNAGMGGVDKSDQMTDQYAGELRTLKCWHKVVFHLIHRTTTNAYIY